MYKKKISSEEERDYFQHIDFTEHFPHSKVNK